MSIGNISHSIHRLVFKPKIEACGINPWLTWCACAFVFIFMAKLITIMHGLYCIYRGKKLLTKGADYTKSNGNTKYWFPVHIRIAITFIPFTHWDVYIYIHQETSHKIRHKTIGDYRRYLYIFYGLLMDACMHVYNVCMCVITVQIYMCVYACVYLLMWWIHYY